MGSRLSYASEDEVAAAYCLVQNDPKGREGHDITVSKDTAGRYHVSLLCDDAVAACVLLRDPVHLIDGKRNLLDAGALLSGCG